MEKLGRGLTWRSFLAIIYAAILLNPIHIYLSLISPAGGVVGYLLAPYVSLLLFTEIARHLGSPLTKRESTIIYYGTQIASVYTIGLLLISHVYYMQSEYFIKFGIADKLPWWFAPPLDSIAVKRRILFHIDWIPTLVFLSILPSIFGLMIDIGAAFFLSYLYIEVEKLPYPMAEVDQQSIVTLTEREPDKIRIFTIAGLLSFIYGLLLYTLPMVSETYTGVTLSLIPYPWIDLTEYIETVLPGAAFGIGTDILMIAVGWIIPPKAIISMLLGMVATTIIGNTLAIRFNIPGFEDYRKVWVPRLGLGTVYELSSLYLWAGPSLGLILSAAIMQLVLYWKEIVKAIKDLLKVRTFRVERGRWYPPLSLSLALIFGGGLGGFLLSLYLSQNPFSVWWIFLILWLIYPFLHAVINGRAFAEIGLGLSIPYLRHALILGSGYSMPDIWFIPAKEVDASAGMSMRIKVCLATQTNPLDYFKAHILALVSGGAMSFIFLSILWNMAPIPSNAYPYAAVTWPVNALYTALWASRSINIFKPFLVALFFILGTILGILIKYLNLPLSLIGLAMGFGAIPPNIISYFIGTLIGIIAEKKIGKEKWRVYKAVILAGLFAGTGLSIGLAVGLTIIAKARWTSPF